MIIDRLTMYNFGVYQGENTFQFTHEKPIVLIGGMNGRGKTTFLEAVLLALYGSNSIAFKESTHTTYSAYLRSLINKDAIKQCAYIELQFTVEDVCCQTYRIRRDWQLVGRKCEEQISVTMNDIEDDFLTQNWAMFIENMLPCALSSFYFFDGEKIAELATSSTDEMLKESIRSMLGIHVLEALKHDLLRSIRRKTKAQRRGSVDQEDMQACEAKREALSTELTNTHRQIETLQQDLQAMDRSLDSMRSEYETKGGLVAEQKQNLLEKRVKLVNAIAQCEEELLDLSAGALPLALVKELLGEIKLQAQDEHDDVVMKQALQQMDAMLETYRVTVPGQSESAKQFVDFVRTRAIQESTEMIYELSDHALFQLISLLETELEKSQRDVEMCFARKQTLRTQMDEIDSYLMLDVDESGLAELARLIQVKTEKRAEVQAELRAFEQQLGSLNNQMTIVNAEYSRKVEAWLEKLELRDDDDRLARYTHIALDLLDKYEVELQKRKAGALGDTITACYRQLANKRNLIERIEMDPRSLEIRYFDADSNVVAKASLSAGEKQLMVIAILWALAICSHKKLPVIIDTPLSRLDSLHREALIRTYFPQASKQTIILSTDSEINHEYYEMMRENVGDEFTLNYDDATRSTTIEKGYFLP